MRLLEHVAKDILRRHGIRVPEGRVATSPEEAAEFARRHGRVVLKAQVPVGGRGLAGGVLFANSPDEAAALLARILGTRIRGYAVRKVLVEEAIQVAREFYISLTVDRSERSYLFLASDMGGVEIEELARRHPERILKIRVDPFEGYRRHVGRRIAKFLGLARDSWEAVDSIASAMYRIMLDVGAELVEVNPLALAADGSLVALDAKILVDDNSLPRDSELAKASREAYSEAELEAMDAGFSYVELEGDVGIVGNGAGLTMATLDLVKAYGGEPADFLDIGGGASSERVERAVRLLLANPRVKAILINIFGGITRCDEVARGIARALEGGARKPIVVRMVGTNEEEGRKLLESAGIAAFRDAEEAARRVVEIVRGGL
ncbi:MAG: ADP-forming succinate--CoA ligase subunit beta [Desulfurococcaceae archaeon]